MVGGNLVIGSMNSLKDFFMGNIFGGLTMGVFLFSLIFMIFVYIYHSLAWQEIAKKRKHKKPWLAWIPFANISLVLEMGKFHWAWIFLFLVPVLGWIALYVLFIISMWRIFEKQKYPGWLSLSIIIPRIGGILYLIIIGIIAWYKKK